MCSISTPRFADAETNRIRVAGNDHVFGAVDHSIIGACGEIIQELFYRVVGGFSGRGLLLSNFDESN